MDVFAHDTVLLSEAVDALAIKPDGLYVDGTYGRGGHSSAILQKLNDKGRLIAIDKDPSAVVVARERHANDPRFFMWHGAFHEFPQALEAANSVKPIDGLLLDLGVSSPQLDDATRGFSFMRDGDLDMRMNPTQGQSAKTWLKEADEADIANVLWLYGEERFSRQIARKIVQIRVETPIETTLQLAHVIAQAVPKREPGKHPATRSFQAIRIKVNQELDQLEAVLHRTLECLAPSGRLVVISFHSLEDRIVKQFMRDHSTAPRLPKHLPIRDTQTAIPTALSLCGKAVKPSDKEIETNVRARSAIMRVAQKN